MVDRDGLHGASERLGLITLAAGYHPIRVEFFQAGGGKAFGLTVAPIGDQGAETVPPRVTVTVPPSTPNQDGRT